MAWFRDAWKHGLLVVSVRNAPAGGDDREALNTLRSEWQQTAEVGPMAATSGTWITSSFDGMGYELLLPDNYSPDQKYPVLMFLHGGGEQNTLISMMNPWFNTPAFRTDYPAIVIAPILQNSSLTANWGGYPDGNASNQDQAIAILQQIQSQYSTDINRVYVTGLSLGGHGSWDLMIKYNAYDGLDGRIFAAALPLAGFEADPEYSIPLSLDGFTTLPSAADISELANVPIWAVEGASDYPQFDEAFAAAVPAGSAFRYTELPLGHDVWDTTYPLPNGKQYYDWLFSQSANLETGGAASSSAGSPPAGTDGVFSPPVDGVVSTGLSSLDIARILAAGQAITIPAGTESIVLVDGTISVGPDTQEATIQRLYEGLLGRSADAGGIAGYDADLNAGQTKASIAAGFLASPEYTGAHGTPPDAQFVANLYQAFLGRTPDAGGAAGFTSALDSGAETRGQVVIAIADAPEAKAHLAATTGFVWSPSVAGAQANAVYQTAFGRNIDAATDQAIRSALSAGSSLLSIVQNVVASPEYQADHAGQSSTTLVASLYQDGLGRAPDPTGGQIWVSFLNAGGSQAQLVLGIATSPEAALHLTAAI